MEGDSRKPRKRLVKANLARNAVFLASKSPVRSLNCFRDRLAHGRAQLYQRAGSVPWDTTDWNKTGADKQQRARRGEVVLVYDPGTRGQNRELFFRQLRERFPRWLNTIVLMTSKDSIES